MLSFGGTENPNKLLQIAQEFLQYDYFFSFFLLIKFNVDVPVTAETKTS